MWLLDVHTRKLEHFEGSNIPKYAILSHRWEEDEVMFQDIQSGRETEMKGYRKIDLCCRQAAGQLEERRRNTRRLSYAWIDTCCIDKTNSAELSEAINSMYKWYKNSAICYVYLSDVTDVTGSDLSSFKHSVWFERGWTLQELLAPNLVVFYDSLWNKIGSKDKLASVISSITDIPTLDLRTFRPELIALGYKTIAEVMSWTARRTTTREEDRAYSLLGLFGVNMPLIYGEGKRAFLRLQEEILKLTDDLTIFAWEAVDFDQQISNSIFASSPSMFSNSNGPAMHLLQEHKEYDSLQVPAGPFLTGEGLSLHLELIPIRRDLYLAPICEYPGGDGFEPYGMMLMRRPDGLFNRYYNDENRCLVKVPNIEISWQLQTSTITLTRRLMWTTDSSFTDINTGQFKAFEIETSHLLFKSTHFSLDDTAQDSKRLSVAATHHGITDIVRLEQSETEARYVLFGNDFEYRPFCLFILPDPGPRENPTPEVVRVSVPRLHMLGLTIGANSDMMPLVKALQTKKDQSWEVQTDHVELHFMPWRSEYATFNISSGEVLEFYHRDDVTYITMKPSIPLTERTKSAGSQVIGKWHERQMTAQPSKSKRTNHVSSRRHRELEINSRIKSSPQIASTSKKAYSPRTSRSPHSMSD